MANLTLTIDDDLLNKARQRALVEKTSVNAVVREYLIRYASERERIEQIIATIDDIARRNHASSEGRKWTREELYDRSVLRKR